MRKLSVQEKKKRGTFRPSREKQGISFAPLTSVPEPPCLAIDGLKYYNDCCNAMIYNRTLTAAYLAGIVRAAGLVTIYNGALKEVEDRGAWQTSKNGFSSKSAAWTVMVEAEKILSAFERSNGLNLIGKSKLPGQPPADDLYYDEMDELDNPKHRAGSRKVNPFNEI